MMKARITILLFLCIFLPLSILAQEEIDINLIDQYHFNNTLSIGGLAFDGEYLWLSDITNHSLAVVDSNNGEIVFSFPYPEGINYGIYNLAFDGENLWAASIQSSYLYKISHDDGSLIDSFTIPYSSGSTNIIFGLTWYDGYLYCSLTSDSHNVIVGIDVETITCIDTLEIDNSVLPGGLTYLNGYFWLNNGNGTQMLKINPNNGQIEGWFPQHYYCLSYLGLTTDEEYIYCSDCFRNIYKYEILDNPADENTIQPLASQIQISAYPNPFNPEIRIEFELMENSKTNLDIYNAKGQKVQSIENNKILVAGNHNYIWNADNIASGIYFIRLSTQYGHSDKKITILK